MRIEKLSLENFRSHAKTEIDFSRLTFVTGPNAVGKSSIQQAIAFLLTGRCNATDAGGRNAEDLIRLGQKEFRIAASIRNNGNAPLSVTRSKSSSTSHAMTINGGLVPVGQAEQGIRNVLGVSADILSAVLDADRFVEMGEADQKRLIAQALDSGSIDIPDDIQRAIGSAMGVKSATKISSVTEVDEFYKVFFGARTEVNREIKALGDMQEPVIPEGMPSTIAVATKIKKLRADKEKLQSRRNERVSSYSNLRTMREDLVERIAEAKEDIETLKSTWTATHTKSLAVLRETIADEEAKILAPEQLRVLQAIAGKVKTIEGLRKDETRLMAQESEKTAQLERFVELKSAACPTCDRKLPLKEKGAIQTSIAAQLDTIKSELADLRTAIDECGDPTVAEQRVALHNEALKNVEKLKANVVNQEAVAGPDVSTRERRVADDEKKLADLPQMAEPNTADIDAEIEVIAARISKGEQIAEDIRTAEMERKAWTEYSGKLTKLRAKADLLETLCHFFGPSGVRAKLAADRLVPFTGALNKSLGAFGYLASFTMEPYQFLITTPARMGQFTVRQLSESERFRFGIAFQIAISKATGLNFVVIDRADMLDGDNRCLLTSMLMNSELDQAIVLSTSLDYPVVVPANLPKDVKFVVLGQPASVGA